MSQTKAQLVSGTTAQDLTVDNINTTSINSGQTSGRKNLIINGAIQVAQRGTSSTVNGFGSVDRFKTSCAGTDELPTHAQADVASGTTPYTLGFRKSYKLTNGNQTGGAGADDRIEIQHLIEAQDIANSGWNYTSASSFITFSFWIKSSVAQEFFIRFQTQDGTQYRYKTGTSSLSADTWTKITKTIPGNSNLQFDNDVNAGLRISFYAFAGTNYSDSSATDTWAANETGNRTSDMTSTWYTTNDATFEITGVQLEVGSTATDFEHRSFAQELALCQRYFQILSSNTSGGLNAHSRYPALGNGTNSAIWYCYHKQTMRVKPSLVLNNITSTTVEVFNYSTSGGCTFQSASMAEGDENHSQINIATTGGLTTASIACWRFSVNGNCHWAVNSEL